MPQNQTGAGASQSMSLEQGQAILGDAMKALDAAYKAANTMDVKDQIYSAMAAIQEENDAVTQAIIAKNTATYKVLTAHFRDSEEALKRVQDNIKTWISYVNVATQVIAAIGKVLPLIALV